MKKIQFLTLTDILFLHKKQIDRFGGSHGVKDMRLLESAIATPQASFGGEYLHPSLPEMASAYFYHLIMNHPFIDGNKRIGALSADVFLGFNGLDLSVDQDLYEHLTFETAQGKRSKSEVAEFLR